MSPPELFAAVERWNEDNSDPNAVEPLTQAEFEALKERYPDG